MCISSSEIPLAVAWSEVPGSPSNKSKNLQYFVMYESSAKSAIKPFPAGSSNCLIVIVSADASRADISYLTPS